MTLEILTGNLFHTMQKRTKQMRGENASPSTAESANDARQEITHRSSGDHVVIDRENGEHDEEMVGGTQLRQKRSIRTAAISRAEIKSEEGPVGASGDNQPGVFAPGSYVEIFDENSPLTQPARLLDFDGLTYYTLQHGLSGAILEGIHSSLVHPHVAYEAGSEVRCFNKKGNKEDRQFSMACEQCTVTGHSDANGETQYEVDCLNRGSTSKMLFPLTNLQRILHKEL